MAVSLTVYHVWIFVICDWFWWATRHRRQWNRIRLRTWQFRMEFLFNSMNIYFQYLLFRFVNYNKTDTYVPDYSYRTDTYVSGMKSKLERFKKCSKLKSFGKILINLYLVMNVQYVCSRVKSSNTSGLDGAARYLFIYLIDLFVCINIHSIFNCINRWNSRSENLKRVKSIHHIDSFTHRNKMDSMPKIIISGTYTVDDSDSCTMQCIKTSAISFNQS